MAPKPKNTQDLTFDDIRREASQAQEEARITREQEISKRMTYCRAAAERGAAIHITDRDRELGLEPAISALAWVNFYQNRLNKIFQK